MDHGSIFQGRMYQDGPLYPRQHVPPGAEPMVDAEPLSDERLDRLKAEWERQRHGRPKLLTPLPRRVRLRLAVTNTVDRAAGRLAGIGDGRAAIWLWRAFHHPPAGERPGEVPRDERAQRLGSIRRPQRTARRAPRDARRRARRRGVRMARLGMNGEDDW